jgi:flagellin-like protein
MRKKGISPLIASVLLIAFVMAIASIFATFATNVIDQPRQETTERATQLTQCSNAIIEVEDGNRTYAELRQSQGDNRAANISVVFQYNGSAPIQVYDTIESKRDIERVFTGTDPGSDVTLKQVTVSIVDQDEPGCTSGPEIEQEFPIQQRG